MNKIFIYREGECSYVKGAIDAAAEKLSAKVLCDTEAKSCAEIAIGDTSREICAKAMAALTEARSTEEERETQGDITGAIAAATADSPQPILNMQIYAVCSIRVI